VITRPSSMRVPPHAPRTVRVKISFFIPNGPWCTPPAPGRTAGVTDVIPGASMRSGPSAWTGPPGS